MDLAQLAELRTPMGVRALHTAAGLADGDPLVAASALRAHGFAPALAAAALTQAVLRRKAVGKFGADAHAMFFTRTGYEQSTRGGVAARRAARLAASGATVVADLGCGIGADAVAFARAGLRVRAVEADPLTAEVARANTVALGVADRVEVSTMDAVQVPLGDVDAVFCDPARRTAGGRRVFDPAAYSPSWDFVAALPGRVPRTVLKLAPGIDHALVPPGAEGEWVSVGGDVVEAAFWCGPLADSPRRASVLRDLRGTELTGTGEALARVAPPRAYLYDPDGAVVRSHLVAEFAAGIDGTIADETIAYVYADAPHVTPFGRCYEIVEALPIAVKRLRAAMRARGVGRLTILKRGSALDVERLRHALRLDGPHEAVLVLTRAGGEHVALLAHPASTVDGVRRGL